MQHYLYDKTFPSKKILVAALIAVVICYVFPIKSYAASSSWYDAKRFGSTGDDNGSGVDIDNNGNIITVSYVTGAADVNGDGDSTDGGAESAAGYGNSDIIISVFNSSGIWQWAKRLGGTSWDHGADVYADDNDTLAFAGDVTGAADVNGDGDSTDGGAESAAGYGNYDSIISVFNSSGTWQWAKRLGGTGADYGKNPAIAPNGNIITVSYVTGAADVNGDGDSTDGGAESAAGYGNSDIIISVFNSSGIWQWAKRLGGTSYDSGKQVSVDSLGNVIVAGYVNGNADVNGDGDSSDGGAESSTNHGGYDFIISVFDSSGTWQWAKRMGGAGVDVGYGLAVDSNNRIVASGYVNGNADVNGDGDSTDGGAESSNGYGSDDMLVTVFNSSGEWQWAKRLGGTSTDVSWGIDTDSHNNVLIVGYVTGNVDANSDGDSVDGGAESSNGYGSRDMFISVFDSFGTWQWAKRLGGTGIDYALDVAADNQDRVSIFGYIQAGGDVNGDGDSTDGGAESAVGYGSVDIILSIFQADYYPPTITVTTDISTTSDSTPSVQGTVTDVISTVLSMEFQLDSTSGSWTACSADDGAFDEASETFVCTSTTLADGAHTMYVRATDNASNVSGNSTDTFTLDTTSSAYQDIHISQTDTTATIAYTTSEAISTQAEWGTSTSYGTTTVETDTSPRVTSHTVSLSGLTKCTDYHFRLLGSDEAGNATPSTDQTFQTTGCIAQNEQSEVVQIRQATSEDGGGGVMNPRREVDTGNQKVFVVIEPKTMNYDAFLSAMKAEPAQLIRTLSSSPPSSSSPTLPKTNAILAGGDNGILGIKTAGRLSWQVGAIQQMWYKTYPPENSTADPARIIPELQKKPSIVALSYTPSDLIPPGNPTKPFNPKYLRLAHSIDGITWKILPTSVVDTKNNTVAALHKLGGYYMIVAGPTEVRSQSSSQTIPQQQALGVTTEKKLTKQTTQSQQHKVKGVTTQKESNPTLLQQIEEFIQGIFN